LTHPTHWQVELAEILARPPRLICEIIAGKRAITPETAKGLEAALSSSAETWMNLETAYQLSKARIETVKVSRRAKLYDRFPVKEVVRRGWVSATTDPARLETQFCEFFEVSSLDEEPSFPHAAKKTSYDSTPMKLQLAWLCGRGRLPTKLGLRHSVPARLRKHLTDSKAALRTGRMSRKLVSC
jgi:HTH-type transcriptional regulator / antitoxin HigA